MRVSRISLNRPFLYIVPVLATFSFLLGSVSTRLDNSKLNELYLQNGGQFQETPPLEKVRFLEGNELSKGDRYFIDKMREKHLPSNKVSLSDLIHSFTD